MTDSTDLSAWVQAAWGRHPQAPAEIAAALVARAPTLPDAPDGAEALRLAMHVILGHLHDEALAERLLAALPAGEAFTVGRQQAAWTIAMMRGEPAPPDMPTAARWRGLHELALAWATRGRAAEAHERLRAQAAEAAASTDTAARRAHAAATNNIASGLRERPVRDAASTALMVAAAQAAREAWGWAGSWQEVERAEYQWSRCLATAGDAAGARAHAQACLAICEAESADAFERFFAHEALAWAARSASDAAEEAAQRARMVALRSEAAASLHPWCDEALAELAR